MCKNAADNKKELYDAHLSLITKGNKEYKNYTYIHTHSVMNKRMNE